MSTFQTASPISATIEIGAGDITVTADDVTESTVTVLPRDNAKSSDQQAASSTTIDCVNGQLTVTTARTWRRFTSKNDGAVTVQVTVPTGSNLTANTGFGTIRTHGELSTTNVKTGMGDLRLDSVGTLDANSGFGDISANTTHDAKVHTGTGTIRLGSVHGSARIKNANGVIEIDDCTADLHVRTSSGDIVIGRAEASVSAGSAAGDIRIAEVSSGSVGVRTGAGSIEIGIREGAAAWLELNSKFGSVRNGLTATPAPAQSDSTVEVRARTGAGDITVERAA